MGCAGFLATGFTFLRVFADERHVKVGVLHAYTVGASVLSGGVAGGCAAGEGGGEKPRVCDSPARDRTPSCHPKFDGTVCPLVQRAGLCTASSSSAAEKAKWPRHQGSPSPWMTVRRDELPFRPR